jgi:hypothetical protein
MSKLQTTSGRSVRYDGQDLTGQPVQVTGGASGTTRSTDALTLTLPAETVSLLLETGSNKVNIGGASYAAVNNEFTIDSSTSTTVTVTISGLDTAVSGGETDPATEALNVKTPNYISDPGTLTTQTETNSQTSGTY